MRLTPSSSSEDRVELFVEEYYRGYTEKFDAYFDSSIAHEFGYKNGLKFDPAIHPFPSFEAIKRNLSFHKKDLVTKYELDKTEWRLFVRAFNQGFSASYHLTEEGITADIRTPIKLDFE